MSRSTPRLSALVLALALATLASAQDVIRVDVTRWALTHGRADTVRSTGIQTPENPRGRPVNGVTTALPLGTPAPPGVATTVLDVIAAQPDPLRITLGLGPNGQPLNPNAPSPLVLAGTTIPSGMTLVVAELANPANRGVGVLWNTLLRFGAGNYYATVSLPGTPIVRGMELRTREHYEAYTANSVMFESPDIGNVIVDSNIEGGTTAIVARGRWVPPPPPDRRPPPQRAVSRIVGWANPMDLELVELRQAPLAGGGRRIWVQANLPNGVEPAPARWFRVAAEANSGTRIFDTQANPFFVDLPLGPSRPYQQPDTTVKFTVVFSAWGYTQLGPTPFLRAPGTSVGLSTWLSNGSTLGDTLVVQVKSGNGANGGGGGGGGAGQTPVGRSLVILLDASGSMGQKGKMAKAKAAAASVLRRLGPDTEVALIVFYDCGRIVVEHHFTTDHNAVVAVLPRIRPASSTPLAEATAFAKAYLRKNGSGKQLDLIILSDGKETCKGDPIKAARD